MPTPKMDPEHFRRLERMYQTAPINQFFKPEMTIGQGQAEVRMQVGPQFHHAAHAAHGALYFKGLDDAAFFAANSLVQGFFVLTISFNTYIERPVSQGLIRCLGQVVMAGKRLITAESRILDEQGRELARGSGQFMPSNVALTPEIGYA